ncbi:MAG: DUF4838 domain-containing protein [Clostridiales bacterium]|nr:DUF4838 domain-containing protein [Clostridiales bacterium]
MIKLHFNQEPDCETLCFARRELENYLQKMLMSSTDTEEIIHISMTVSDSPKISNDFIPALDDCFHIYAAPDHIEITASNSRAVLLGVYRLLTQLGCRFLMPGQAHEIVPHIFAKQLRADITEKAAFRHRGVCIEGADSLENVLDFIDWLPKLGYNSFFLQHLEPESFLNHWYLHTFNPMQKEEHLSKAAMESMYRQIDSALACRSILHHRVGHGWTCKAIGFDHACIQAGPPSPEQKKLLAMVNGQKLFWEGVPSNTNLCYSEPEAHRAFVQAVTDYAVQHTEVDYLHVWLADEYNNVCECEKCRQTTPSDLYIRLLNDIDAKLTEMHLKTRIVMLLYTELLWPPREEKLKNPGRFTLMFAPITRTFERSYDECGDIPPVPVYHRNKIELPNTLEENISFLQGWQKMASLDSFDYDYPLGRAHYGDLGYYHIARIIFRDIKALSNLKLNGYISCQELRAAFPNAFPGYIMGKVLWNRNISFEALEEEYFSALYGQEWQAARDYLRHLSQLCSCDYFNGIGPRYSPQLALRFQEAQTHVRAFSGTISSNIKMHSGIVKTAWHLLDYHAKYCKLLLKALAALAAGQNTEAQQAWNSVMQLIRRHENDYQPYLDVYRALEVATKYTGFELDMPRQKGLNSC